MERNIFEDCYRWLEKFHGKQTTAEYRENFWSKFENEHDEVFIEAVNISTERLPPGQFPTVERMRRFLTDARERANEREKKAEPKRPFSRPQLPDHRNTDRGKRWLAGIIAVAEGKMKAEDLIQEMRENS